jgi:hypothetical protein
MPSVRNLNGLRRSTACTFGIAATTVAADNLHARVSFEPSCKTVSAAIGQQVDHTASFQITQDRAVATAAPPRPIIDTENTHARVFWPERSAHHAQKRGSAHRHAEPLGKSRACFPAHAATDVVLDVAQTNRAARASDGDVVDPLSEHLLAAGLGRASQATNFDDDGYRPTLPRQVGEHSAISTVDASRWQSAGWAKCRGGTDGGKDGNAVRLDLDTRYDKASRHRWQVTARYRHRVTSRWSHLYVPERLLDSSAPRVRESPILTPRPRKAVNC